MRILKSHKIHDVLHSNVLCFENAIKIVSDSRKTGQKSSYAVHHEPWSGFSFIARYLMDDENIEPNCGNGMLSKWFAFNTPIDNEIISIAIIIKRKSKQRKKSSRSATHSIIYTKW